MFSMRYLLKSHILLIAFFCHSYILNAQKAGSPFLVVNKISIEGNRITNRKIILRELTFTIGDTIAVIDIEKYKKRSSENLYNTKLFNVVTLTPVTDSCNISWLVQVDERWYIWPIPILKIADRNLSAYIKDGDFSRINYGGYLRIDNFRGMREEVRIRATLGYRKQLSLRYSTYNLNKNRQHGLSAEVTYYTNNEISYGSDGNRPLYFKSFEHPLRQVVYTDLTYQYRPKHNWYHTFSIGTVHSSIADTIKILNSNYFELNKNSFQYGQFRYELTFDRRNSREFPLSGSLFKMELGHQNVFKSTSLDLWYAKITTGLYSNIYKRLYTGFDFRVKACTKKNLPFYLNEAIGFRDYVRGYEYYVTNGANYFINKSAFMLEILTPKTLNLSILPEGKSSKTQVAVYWSVFADTGYVTPDTSSPKENLEGKFIYGFGTGLSVVSSYDFTFRLEYSCNRQWERGFFIHLGTPFLNN